MREDPELLLNKRSDLVFKFRYRTLVIPLRHALQLNIESI